MPKRSAIPTFVGPTSAAEGAPRWPTTFGLIDGHQKYIADIIIPNIDVLRFSVINGIGMLLFIGSLYT